MLHESDPESPPAPAYDPVTERLLRARTIIISGEITQRLASTVSSQLIALAAESDGDIKMFVNSQGGHVEAGDTIHDLIRFVRAPVRTKIVVPVQFVPNLIAALQEHWRVYSESYSNVGWNKGAGPIH